GHPLEERGRPVGGHGGGVGERFGVDGRRNLADGRDLVDQRRQLFDAGRAPGVAVEAEAAAGRLRGGEVGGGGGRRRRPDEPGVDVLRLAGRDLRVARARQRTFVGGGDAA